MTTPYDALAPHYAAYAGTRATYHHAVDQAILGQLRRRGGAWLDVGSADGGRAVRLARAASTTRLVLSDPSAEMIAQCRRHDVSDVWHAAAESLPAPPPFFDVVTCLWGVLGAIDGSERRIVALEHIRALLSSDGQLFLDVPNRYNTRTAGRARVLARMLRDSLRPSEANGAVRFTWDVGGARIPARGHLFTDDEARRLFALAGLRVVRCRYIDYTTGDTRSWTEGQMLFELAKN